MGKSTTYVCDRCDKEFNCIIERSPCRPLGESGNWDREEKPPKEYKDFCDECAKSFLQWLRSPRTAAQKK